MSSSQVSNSALCNGRNGRSMPGALARAGRRARNSTARPLHGHGELSPAPRGGGVGGDDGGAGGALVVAHAQPSSGGREVKRPVQEVPVQWPAPADGRRPSRWRLTSSRIPCSRSNTAAALAGARRWMSPSGEGPPRRRSVKQLLQPGDLAGVSRTAIRPHRGRPRLRLGQPAQGDVLAVAGQGVCRGGGLTTTR